ncbi:MAG: TlyA family RNA methyltransferase, partial [Eggerthellaceae bacterium]|nr:TlyA family RNA methyltransferase [Eggerthellaceae bacterium]
MNKKAHKQRLDEYLVAGGFCATGDEALRMILAHKVKVDDIYATSAAQMITPLQCIEVKQKKKYVSRGGYKLETALDYFDIDVSGKRCIDVGSSTGGFTDCLLQRGALEVSCVDVNYSQLHWSLRTNERVHVFERTNIRTARPEDLGAPFDVVVCDLSFIGLRGLSSQFARLCKPGSLLISLVKPQFEGRRGITSQGIVTDEGERLFTVEMVKEALTNVGFCVIGFVESSLVGTNGNQE